MSDTTVVIKTLGRPTLKAAMRSAKREGFKTIVVSDGPRVSAQGAYKYIRLGKQWGYYGGMAANVGAALAETEFITFLDDDDEFAVKLDAGKTFMLSNAEFDASADDDIVVVGYVDMTYFSNLVDYDTIKAKANTSDVSIEYFVAST